MGRVRVIVGRIPNRASYGITLEDGKHFASYDVVRNRRRSKTEEGENEGRIFAVD